ncbi:putative signal transduction protein with Nacht domain [[Leptolyngbya] sp. PCC 7376]|uniref:NACHT domain-containing protein n=1 Tax=[Leptolyngbya] sp. PCC 7376 TaxID=111781 RepID=UPI00029F43E1|nr:NACHT domain-containing protein [[Leptolyngbya] sp. PCC 7376]AFY36696.1 putative signal transduction protein with Nacht domain [[Leptolyngbya] sp. PCC 7376]
MIDWLVVWGAAQVGGAIARPILEELAKGALEEYVTDFFKDCLGDLVEGLKPDDLKKAYGLALKEFLKLVEEELEFNQFQPAQIKEFKQPLKKFVQDERIAATLGLAFQEECRSIPARELIKVWKELDSPYLPDAFDWGQISKGYIRAVKILLKNSSELREIFSAQNLEQIAANTANLAGIQPDFNLAKYAETIQEQYGNLKLDSLDSSSSAYNGLRLWKIFVPQTVRECQEFLPQVFDIPKDRLKELRERGEIDDIELEKYHLEESRRRYVSQSPRSVLEMLQEPDKNYVVILGDPGSGKSTLLQYLALDWAEKPLRELPAHPLPLLIELRLYARDKAAGKCNSFLEFLHQGNVVTKLNQLDLDEKLREGNVLALFDGVDEVFDSQLREEVINDIHGFTNDYPPVRVVVTSRWLGYKAQRLRDAEFQHFMLQDFENEQVTTFIERWHELTFGGDGTEQKLREQKEARLKKAVTDSKAIKQLAVNPLLLTMMAILNRHQELPRDRARLYERASEVLLHQWDIERNLIDQNLDPRTIDVSEKQAILRRVADYMQSSKDGLKGNVISAKELKKILRNSLKELDIQNPKKVAGIMLDQLRNRNFILCDLGANNYAFVHRTFLEYFVAESFLYRFKEAQDLSFDAFKKATFGEHWCDESWREVLLLISGNIYPSFVKKVIFYLLSLDDESGKEQNVFLALDCFIEISHRLSNPKELSDVLLSKVKDVLPTVQNQEKYCPDKNFGGVIITQKIQTQIKLLRYLDQLWLDKQSLVSYLESLLDLDCKGLYHEIVNFLVYLSDNKEKLLSWLKVQIKTRRDDYFIEEVVGYHLTWYGINDLESIKIIIKMLEEEFNSLPIDTNNEFWERIIYSDNIRVDILKFLDEKALHYLSSFDVLPELQENFLRYLAYKRNNLFDVDSILKFHAQNSPHQGIRSSAVRILGLSQHSELWLFDFLKSLLLTDTFHRDPGNGYYYSHNIRTNILEILLNKYEQKVDLTPIFIERIQNDPDEQVRDYATKQLEKLKSVAEDKS